MAPPLDQDWLYLDKIIVLCDETINLANKIKEDSDDPVVLQSAMHIESNLLVIWKLSRDYRPRLEHLKKVANDKGLELFEKIAALADQIKETATGPPPNNNHNKKATGSPLHGKPEQKKKG